MTMNARESRSRMAVVKAISLVGFWVFTSCGTAPRPATSSESPDVFALNFRPADRCSETRSSGFDVPVKAHQIEYSKGPKRVVVISVDQQLVLDTTQRQELNAMSHCVTLNVNDRSVAQLVENSASLAAKISFLLVEPPASLLPIAGAVRGDEELLLGAVCGTFISGGPDGLVINTIQQIGRTDANRLFELRGVLQPQWARDSKSFVQCGMTKASEEGRSAVQRQWLHDFLGNSLEL